MKKRWLMGASLLTISLLVGCGETPTIDDDDPVTPVEETYDITIAEDNEVELDLSKNSAKPGETVEITVKSVPDGRTIKEITTNIDGVTVMSRSSTQYYFVMPKGDVELTVVLTDIPQDTYTLTVVNEVGAEIVTLMNSQQDEMFPDENGVYNLAPSESYLLRLNASTYVSVRLNDNVVSSQEGYYMFTMPSRDSVLTITELQAYSLTLDYDEAAFKGLYVMNGDNYSDINLNAVEEGTSIHVEYVLNLGYEISNIYLDGEAIDFRGTSVDFTSAAHDSVLKIETIEVEVDGGLVTYEVGEGARVEIGSAKNADGSLVSIPEYNPNSTVFKSGTKLYLRAYIMNNWLNIYTIDQVTVNGEPVTLDEDGAYQFTVEDGGVQIVVTTKAVEYNLSYTPSGNETCAFYDEEGNPITKAVRNQTVTAEFTQPNANLALYNIKENGEDGGGTIEGNTYTFVFTHTSDLTLTAEWADTTASFALSYTTDPVALQDSVEVNFYSSEDTSTPITQAHPLDTIYMEVADVEGYVFDEATLNDETLREVTVGGKDYYTFVMPNSAANLKLTFSEDTGTHDITVDTSSFGNHTVYLDIYDSNFQWAGTAFYRDLTPGTIVYFDVYVQDTDSFKVLANGTEITERQTIDIGGVTTNAYKFVMPDEDVTITLEF